MQTKLWYIQLLLQHMQITPIILQFLRLLFVCLSPQTCVHKQSYAEQGTGITVCLFLAHMSKRITVNVALLNSSIMLIY